MAKRDYSQLKIDILKLYTEGDTKKWNEFLQECFEKRQIDRLMDTRIGLQKGMDDLVKQKLNTDHISEMFIRWNRSIELTAKKIITVLNPLPGDNPKMHKEFMTDEWLRIKRKRDHDFELFILKSSY